MEPQNELPPFADFEHDWKRRHKSSLPRKVTVSTTQELFWIAFWILVAASAALFSAAHTVPAAELTLFQDLPRRGTLAITAFIIVELVIFGAAAKRHEIRWLTVLLFCSLAVALIGNFSSSVQAVADNGGNLLNQIGGVLLSVIAPVTALAAGEVLHIKLGQMAAKRRAAADTYQQAWKDTEAKINAAYTRLENEFKQQHSRHFTKFHELEPKPRPKTRVRIADVAREIRENGHENLSTEEMMSRYAISAGSTTRVRELLKSNGHVKEV